MRSSELAADARKSRSAHTEWIGRPLAATSRHAAASEMRAPFGRLPQLWCAPGRVERDRAGPLSTALLSLHLALALAVPEAPQRAALPGGCRLCLRRRRCL